MAKPGLTVEKPDRELSGAVAVVGVGNTDYAYDYATSRELREGPKHDIAARLAVTAFERALDDAGLKRSDVDALGVGYYVLGGADPRLAAESIGLRPKVCVPVPPIMAGVIPKAVGMLMRRECDTIAVLYSAPNRSGHRAFGGDAEKYGATSYEYYHPWGWSSQAAHWALKFRYYQSLYGAKESDLGAVAMGLRQNAQRNENAIMRAPMTIDDYLNSRYVVEPLHLFDICLVSDGAVCIILRRRDMAHGLRQDPILVSGWGHAYAPDEMLRYLVVEQLHPQYQAAGAQALEMAGISLSDIDHFEGYDASTIHLVQQIEGYGLVPAGEALEYWKAGHMALGGELPVNVSGGLLSEAYTQGWGHVVEAVRQLRHTASGRQVSDVATSMTSLSTTDAAFPVIFRREDA